MLLFFAEVESKHSNLDQDNDKGQAAQRPTSSSEERAENKRSEEATAEDEAEDKEAGVDEGLHEDLDLNFLVTVNKQDRSSARHEDSMEVCIELKGSDVATAAAEGGIVLAFQSLKTASGEQVFKTGVKEKMCALGNSASRQTKNGWKNISAARNIR